MKRFRVETSPEALADIEEAYRWMVAERAASAAEWIAEVVTAIESLETMPARGFSASETRAFKEGLRQVLVGRGRSVYRILYTVEADQVRIARVRHASRAPLTGED